MVIKPFTLLFSISRQQCSINVKKNKLPHPDRINVFSQLAHNVIKLAERIVIHPVKEPRQGRLRHKRLFSKDGREHGGTAEIVGTVVHVVRAEDLVDHLQQVLIVLVDAEQCGGVGLEIVFQKLFETRIRLS